MSSNSPHPQRTTLSNQARSEEQRSRRAKAHNLANWLLSLALLALVILAVLLIGPHIRALLLAFAGEAERFLRFITRL